MTRQVFLLGLLSLAQAGWSIEPPEDPDFARAVDLLVRGLRYERAAELLRSAQNRLPEDYLVSAALGCAGVSRVATLLWAFFGREMLDKEKRSYPAELAAWEKEKQETGKEPIMPRPAPPPNVTIKTKDDGQPYRLTRQQLTEVTRRWAAEATEGFNQAGKRAKTSQEQAESAFLEGWGQYILLSCASIPPEEKEEEATPKEEDPPQRTCQKRKGKRNPR